MIVSKDSIRSGARAAGSPSAVADIPLDDPDVDDCSDAGPGPSEAKPPETTVVDRLDAMDEKLGTLIVSIGNRERQLGDLAARDELLGHVHKRLAAFEQEDRRRSFVEPLARKIAAIHRSILDQMAHAKQALRALPGPMRTHSTCYWAYQGLDSVRVELETTLSDFGVEVFTSDGLRFDRSCQEAIQRVPTDDAARVGTVVNRVAPGFRIGERIVVAERVAVYVAQGGRKY